MTPAQQAKASGLKSLNEMGTILCVPRSTLESWHNLCHDRFTAMVAAAVAVKNQGQDSGPSHPWNHAPPKPEHIHKITLKQNR